MKLKLLVSILPAIVLLSACGQTDVHLSGQQSQLAERTLTEAPKGLIVYPDDRPSVPDGKLVWNQKDANCASCHGANGSGGSAPVDLSNALWSAAHKPKDTYVFLTYGDQAKHHQAYRDKLSRADLWNLTVYVHSLGVPVLSEAEIKTIDPVFGSNCAVCHGTKGDGDGPLMRNLEPMPANFQKFDRFFDRTDDVLFDHIANGIKWEGMPNFLGKEDKAKKVKFDEAYIRKMVAYVRKFQVSNAPTVVASSVSPTGEPPAPSATGSGAPSADNKDKGGSAAPKDQAQDQKAAPNSDANSHSAGH